MVILTVERAIFSGIIACMEILPSHKKTYHKGD